MKFTGLHCVLALATSASAFTPLQQRLRMATNLHSETAPSTLGDKKYDYAIAVLGDLHMDPREMEDYETGREHWQSVFDKSGDATKAIVSLGDLGESKNCDHNPTNPSELFAGTTPCHTLAADYLSSFGVPYEVVGGNHDLEGIDEFATDEENLEVFLRLHGKPAPHFYRQVAEKTILVGLTSTVFRDAVYTSHEVTIDQAQVDWFEETLKSHPASDGWRVFVFTHAPPNGSGLRVLQENHVVNGCCWLNHSGNCAKFIELVREHRCVKAWFSGHFHLGQDYQDSITFPTIDPKDGPYPNRGSCVFGQVSVMRSGTSRDGRQQSRLIRGNEEGFEICTVDHKNNGAVRLDATITYSGDSNEVGIYAHEDEAYEHDKFFKVYQPCAGDALHPPDDGLIQFEESFILDEPVAKDTVKWWYMDSGHVLGMLDGMLIEYDRSTLAPLGLVVGADELLGKRIGVIDSGIEGCDVTDEGADSVGMEGADCADYEGREQAVILMDGENTITVVQPNEDGSYWRKIVRNKMVRMKEVRREKAAKEFAKQLAGSDDAEVVSSWGPYTTTSGTAKKTGVSGLTTPAAR